MIPMLDLLRDPLKGKAVVPQKYIDTLMRQGWVKVVRCGECKYLYFADNRVPTERALCCGRTGDRVTSDWFCANGEAKEDETNGNERTRHDQ